MVFYRKKNGSVHVFASVGDPEAEIGDTPLAGGRAVIRRRNIMCFLRRKRGEVLDDSQVKFYSAFDIFGLVVYGFIADALWYDISGTMTGRFVGE